MSDVLLIANSTSSLIKSLQSPGANVDVNKWVAGIKPSHPESQQEVLYLSARSPAFGSVNNIVLSKLGVVTSSFIKYTLNGVENDGTNDLSCSKYLALAMTEKIALASHSRMICEAESYRIMEEINNLPPSVRNVIKDAGMYYLHENHDEILNPKTEEKDVLGISTKYKTAKHQIVCYLPLDALSPFKNNPKNALWASFTESLDLQISVRPVSDFFKGTAGTSKVPTGLDIHAMVVYNVLDPVVYKAAQAKNFQLNKSLQMLYEKSELMCRGSKKITTIKASTGTAGAAQNAEPFKQETIVMTSTATCVARSISIYCYKERAANALWSPDLHPIVRARLSCAGRTIFDMTFEESKLLSCNLHSGYALFPKGSSSSVFARDPDAHCFNYSFASSKDISDGYTGGVAFSGLSSQTLEVTIAGMPADDTSGGTYHVEAWLNAYSVKSISSNEGRFQNSLSV